MTHLRDPLAYGLHVTRHAEAQMRARGLRLADVCEAIRDPDVTEPSRARCVRYVRGDLVVVLAHDRARPALVTVLLRERARWDDDRARAAFAASA